MEKEIDEKLADSGDVNCEKKQTGDAASVDQIKNELDEFFKSKNNYNALLYYALGKIRYYFSKDEIDGFDANDFLQVAVEKLMNGKRKWYKDKVPVFKNQIFLVVLSLIRNKFSELYEKPKKTDQNTQDLKRKKAEIISIYNEYGIEIQDYLKVIEEDEEEADKLTIEEELEIIKESLLDDETAYLVFDELLKLGNSNIKVAESLGLSVKEVENTKKRIRRKKAN